MQKLHLRLSLRCRRRAMESVLFTNGCAILEDRVVPDAEVEIRDGRICAVRPNSGGKAPAGRLVDLAGGYLAPGFIDIHVHGGAGHDFMDGTPDAFRAVCQAHARHGTTSLLPTTTVAR